MNRYFLLAILIVLAGCAPAVAPGDSMWKPDADLVWPQSPAKPRIRFLRAISPLDFITEEGGGRQFFRWFSGEKAQVYPLIAPYGICADGKGRMWVADPKLRAVHLFDLSRRRIDYLRSAGAQELQSPVGVAYDNHSDLLYVSDSLLNQVFVFDGKLNFAGTRNPVSGYGRPAGLALDDAGNLFVADALKGSIELFAADGTHQRSLRSAFPEDGGFNRPSNVAVDRQGRIYVVDSMNFRIEVLRPDGKPGSLIGHVGDGPGAFARPRGVAADSEGHVYVADAAFDNIQIFDSEGNLLLFFGSPGKEQGQFNLPAGLFFDHLDRLYVVDSYNARIQIFEYLSESPGSNL